MRVLLLILFVLLSLPASATYTKIANNGAELPDSSTSWACTRDNANGLLWEVKTSDGGLRDMGKTYTNYDSSYGTQAEVDSAFNSIGFAQAVNLSGLCGYAEWRMPSLIELQSLGDLSFFPNTAAAVYWSNTPAANDAAHVWDVDFSNGGDYTDSRSQLYRVRLVRSTPANSFTLTVSLSGAGAGSINSGGIDCRQAAGSSSGNCTTQRGSGSSVTLRATPAAGGHFAGWGGACSATDPSTPTCTLSMDAAKSVTASFTTYSKVAHNGADLPDSALLGNGAADWGCTRDNASGLIWEVKTDDRGLRDQDNVYTNYDDITSPQKYTNGNYVNPTQAELDAGSNSLGLVKALHVGGLCGYGEWRMPSQDELRGLLNLSVSPTISPTFFPNTLSSTFWSSSPYINYPQYGWRVNFYDGSAEYGYRRYGHRVRLVRGSPSLPQFTLTASASGAGVGRINSGGLDCARAGGSTVGTCTAPRESGSSVTLSVTLAEGSLFGGWGGACSGTSSSCTLTMDAAKSVSARFDVGPAVNGACGMSNGQALSAAPVTHLCLAGNASAVLGSGPWTWNCSAVNGGTLAACSASIETYALRVSKSGAGSIASDLSGIACGSACSTSYRAGSVVILTATPAANSRFAGWGGACSGSVPTCQVIMSSAKAATASFTSYSKIAHSGADLPDSALLGNGAADWACTRDNASGLVWEVKTSDGALRDRNKTYTNYDDATQAQKRVGTVYVNPTQAEIDAASNSIGLVNAVNASALCGYSEWRMPSKDELSGLLVLLANPTINSTFFPNTPSSAFWSDSPYAYNSGSAWRVDFDNGGVYDYSRYYGLRVRLVRGGQSFGPFALSLSSSGSGSGTLSADAGSLNCASNAGTNSGGCSANLPGGVLVTLTASPEAGSTFAAWGGACSGSSPTCTLKINAAHTVTARFNGSSAPVSPGTPTDISSIAGSGSAQISFSAPANDGGATITGYTATCMASGQTTRRISGNRSPLTVRNLAGNVQYQCTLTASNEVGSSLASASTSVKPTPGKNNLTPILMLLLD